MPKGTKTQVKKAMNARKNVKKGQHQKRKHRVYKRPRFFKPVTLKK